MYKKSQIKAAKDTAEKFGYLRDRISDELAIKFIDWYLAHQTKYQSDHEAVRIGLSDLLTNGIEQQRSWWEDELGSPDLPPSW